MLRMDKRVWQARFFMVKYEQAKEIGKKLDLDMPSTQLRKPNSQGPPATQWSYSPSPAAPSRA